ncbi:MAG TPA: peptidylprolyl isomerase [Candidatus Eisenbacteria bacterium]|nr:peptidylprolyl isomerase [Candidatus Eisenbacteria bacterium]
MTFRARPVTRRPGRSGWDSGDRRTTLISVGFVVAIVVSVLILVGYAGWTWYDDHFGTAASVNGTVINKDAFRTRYAIEKFRIDYTAQRVQTLLAAGRISASSASQQLSFLDQRRNSLPAIALERLIDVLVQAKLAGEAGIQVADADIDAQLLDEATSQEERHSWLIEVTPASDPDTVNPTDEQKAAAGTKAEAALADLKAGKAWDDVAKTVSTAASAPQAGDLGWLPKESGYDVKLMEALFALAQGATTDVVEGDDGVFRIGRVTEIAPASVDQTFSTKIDEAGIKLADYRTAIRGDVVRKRLNDKVVADLSQPGKQRHVLQIYLPSPSTAPQPDAVKVRHILFSPNDDASAAGSLPLTDPAWEAAHQEADAAYQELLTDPTKFDELARTKSDEGSARSTGGKQPWYDPTSPIDKDFAAAIFKEGLQPGDLIEPFRTAFGWHVVQFMRPLGGGDEAWLQTIKEEAAEGTDFAQLARDQGEGAESADGGDIGWIVEGQFAEDKGGAIFNTAVGSVSDVVAVPQDGAYLFKILAEEVRTPTDEQLAIFKQNGFSDWYAGKKAEADIVRNVAPTVPQA